MQRLRYDDDNFAKAVQTLNRSADPHPTLRLAVAEIIETVRARGDSALLEYTVKFGGPRIEPDHLRVSTSEMEAAQITVSDDARNAIATSHKNVLAFAKKSLRKSWSGKNLQGATVGERFDPFQRVGIYVPGGTAPLVSTAIMTVTLAAAAGVPEIVVATPADANGEIHPALLYALNFCGATEIYKAGGAQAIAALAYGTESIQPTVKIFGPGNAYVVEAKRQVFGQAAVDLLPGPSEILVIADTSANPAWIAADMLAQAEHGHGSTIVCISNSSKILDRVATELKKQSSKLERHTQFDEVLARNTHLIQVKSLEDAIAITNDFAPEHLNIVAKNEDKLAEKIFTAGAIFLGASSPVAAGDFLAGPSHELPTGGAGKGFPGLTADQFQRRTSVVKFTAAALKKSLTTIQTLCEIEGLDAHARSAEIRQG